MAISEFEAFRIDKIASEFCKDRNKHFPPDQLYLDFKLDGQTLYLFEVRPKWNDPSIKTEMMLAKFRYITKDRLWKLYWQRQDMKWEQYKPGGTHRSLQPLLELVWDDTSTCFWG